MKIRYVVRQFCLSTDPEHCVARVVPAGTIDFEQLVDLVAQRNTTAARSDILAVLEDYDQVIIDRLRDGYNVNTPLVDYTVVVEGRFEGLQDLFDPRRHRVRVRYRAGRRLRRAERHFTNLELAHDDRYRAPSPEEVLDVVSGTRNERLTPGGIARVWGYRLKFDPADPDQGIFLVSEDWQETRVTIVAHNGPKWLFFSFPDLPAGRYRLEVRSVPRNASTLRRGVLPYLLTVEE